MNDFNNQIIWNDSFMKVDKIVFCKKMFENGIIYVKDLYDEENNLLSIGNLNQAFSLYNLPFTGIQGIINAISVSWERDFYPFDNDPQTPFKTFCKSSFVSHYLYKSLINAICTPPTALIKWERI